MIVRELTNGNLQRSKLNKRDFLKLSYRQDHRCAGCRELLHWDSQVDHVVPWSLSANDDVSNLQVLCPTCHANKSGDEAAKIRRVRRHIERGEGGICVCWACEAILSPYFDNCYRCNPTPRRAGRSGGLRAAAEALRK